MAATNIHSQKQNIIQELQSQLAELEKRRKIFEDQIQADQTEKNIELKQSQQDQYQVKFLKFMTNFSGRDDPYFSRFTTLYF